MRSPGLQDRPQGPQLRDHDQDVVRVGRQEERRADAVHITLEPGAPHGERRLHGWPPGHAAAPGGSHSGAGALPRGPGPGAPVEQGHDPQRGGEGEEAPGVEAAAQGPGPAGVAQLQLAQGGGQHGLAGPTAGVQGQHGATSGAGGGPGRGGRGRCGAVVTPRGGGRQSWGGRHLGYPPSLARKLLQP